ncbi:MAG TPA: glycoside hydrolase family 5 protein [bacterium]|nr:glycoside hydrolase family 5 protein [bacterium]HPR88025.1 glycoside hydrolase family 5 protein [bacterium]
MHHTLRKTVPLLLAAALLLVACKKQPTPPLVVKPKYTPITAPLDPFIVNQRIARCVNFGNALEAPNEGEWGITLEARYFQLLDEAGFTGIRLPIRWSTHAQTASPYTISDDFFARIDWAVQQALDRGMAIVINMHHYEEIFSDPPAHKERFLALWRQIAEHYQAYPADLLFEPLNEPNANLNAVLWNQYLAEAIAVIRQSNPYRTLVIGPPDWNAFSSLDKLVLPAGENNLIITFHYYNPFHFTHQGTSWNAGSDAWLGTTWGSAAEMTALQNELESARNWARTNNRPLFMGEFGAFNKADMNSRKLWTEAAARQAENRAMSWGYWEFGSGFAVYNLTKNEWYAPLLKALIP